ncbi:MAG: hypothetical protein GTO14_19535 [Anaerolineales bacterium]|nr:hypothetical protein [Anaerolineales bacterium]
MKLFSTLQDGIDSLMRRAEIKRPAVTWKAITRSTSHSVAIALIALVVGVASLGLAERLWSQTLKVEGTVDTEEMNVEFTDAYTNDDSGNIDPGYDKDVASCEAVIGESGDTVSLTITNGYPSYTCQFWVEITNVGAGSLLFTAPEITSPDVLTVIEPDPQSCGILDPSEVEVETFTIHVEQEADQGANYMFTIRKTFSEPTQATIGFWKSWDSHNTFTRGEIEDWLENIALSSEWLDAHTIEDMEDVFAAGGGKSATAEGRFLAQYLATRLNEQSGLLCAGELHNVTKQDPGNYLDLADPENASLQEIIAAIELKFGTVETKEQFNTLYGICDALNNLEI